MIVLKNLKRQVSKQFKIGLWLVLMFGLISQSQMSYAQKQNNVAELSDKLDQSYYETEQGGKFYFSYEEKYKEGDLEYVIYNNKREVVPATLVNLNSGNVANSKIIGINIYMLDVFGASSGFLFNAFYTIEVDDGKGKVTKLRFRCKANEPDGQG